jgi:hypothetical protein
MHIKCSLLYFLRKRPLRRPRRRWIGNIKMDLLEMGLSVVDWLGLAQDRYRWRALVNAVMNNIVLWHPVTRFIIIHFKVRKVNNSGNELSVSIKCWETTEWLHNLWPLEWHSAPQSYYFLSKQCPLYEKCYYLHKYLL